MALHRRLLPADGELALGHAQPIDYIIGHKLDANRERERMTERGRTGEMLFRPPQIPLWILC